MTELKKEELQKAINEITKLISSKQREKVDLECQRNKLEFSIKDLQTEIESLKKEEQKKRREYFNSLLDYAKEKLNTLDAESNWVYQDEQFVIFQKNDCYYLFSIDDSELTEISEKYNEARIYESKLYEDLLDEIKSDSYDSDTFIRRLRVDEVVHYYCNDSLADYMYWIDIRDVDLDDLLEDESEYIKGEDLTELNWFIETDAQYFTQEDFYSLKDEEDETNK